MKLLITGALLFVSAAIAQLPRGRGGSYSGASSAALAGETRQTVNVFLHSSGLPEISSDPVAGNTATRRTMEGPKQFSLEHTIYEKRTVYRLWLQGQKSIDVSALEAKRKLRACESQAK